MPRGAKGWPIDSNEHPSWTQIALIFGFFGGGVPGGFAIAIHYSTGVQKMSPWFIFVMWWGVCLLIFGLITLFAGRLKYTPTAVLWVPSVGRTRWIAFADVRRMMNAPKVYRFDSGPQFIVPKIGRQIDSKWARQQRQTVNAWLDPQFEPIATRSPADVKASITSGVIYIVVTPLTFLALTKPLFYLASPDALSWIGSASSDTRRLLGILLFVSTLAVMVALPMAAFAVARFVFGIRPSPRGPWRAKRAVKA